MEVLLKSKKKSSKGRLKNEASEEEVQLDRIVAQLLSKYMECDESGDSLGGTIENLRENIKPGICLICIEDVENADAIWSCQSCYCILHLVCIQRWAKDSIANVKAAAAQKGFKLPIIWCCPKCRGEYGESQFPLKYTCFCGKKLNPDVDPWSAPHSCGEVCGKPLKPECGHSCVMLCHAGACPKCPKQVDSACYCGQSIPRTLRCYAKSWSCGQKCSKALECGFHNCSQTCHESADCPKCDIPVTVNCKCMSPSPVTIRCADLAAKSVAISCGKRCGKPLNCGIHECKKICHEGGCGICQQSCPCGNKSVECSGTKNITGWEKSCGGTCEKVLECGIHNCHQKCHGGECGECLELVNRKCKCGAYEKEVLCSREFVCTTRCRKTRDCNIHQCNKKCCNGDCAPCQMRCGRNLACKNHKCEANCGHAGPCYPCSVLASVKCRCGRTVRQVPCGSERKCKPPSCQEPCELKPKCSHSKIQDHRCHFDNCPRCLLPCGASLECGHICKALCHTFKTNVKPCPNCTDLVPTKCTLHSTVLVQCSKLNSSCEENCNKKLACSTHVCLKRCHQRLTEFCGACPEPCGLARPVGCTHECPLGCHEGDCPSCELLAKTHCHCGTETMFVTCSRQNNLIEEELSCKNQCTKKLSCGHRCLSICHSGPCVSTDRCRRKLKLTCKCRRLKKELECFLVDKENMTLLCSEPTCIIKPINVETPPGAGKRKNKKKKNPENEARASESEAQVVPETQDSAVKTSIPLKLIGMVVAVGLSVIGFYFMNG